MLTRFLGEMVESALHKIYLIKILTLGTSMIVNKK